MYFRQSLEFARSKKRSLMPPKDKRTILEAALADTGIPCAGAPSARFLCRELCLFSVRAREAGECFGA